MSLMQRQVEARYVTLLFLLWHAETRELTMANAGALPPMICRGGEILKLRVEGVPLGLLPDREYDKVVFQAEPGDLIVLYSDGITDQLDPDDEEYGRRRLVHVLKGPVPALRETSSTRSLPTSTVYPIPCGLRRPNDGRHESG